MSGHSKWAGIKHRKAAVDKKKGVAFSKAARAIISAVRQGGPDPDANLKLKYAIEEAREVNMPRDNIERAIKRGSGEGSEDVFEELVYEGFGPGKVAVYIEILTDNRHRTAPEMRKLFEKHGANLGDSGTVAYFFKPAADARIPRAGIGEEKIMELTMDAGADDYAEDGDFWVVTAAPQQFLALRKAMEKAGIVAASAGLMQLPAVTSAVKDVAVAERLFAFLDALEEQDDVQKVYSNADIPDDVMALLEGS
jgi:YebC/PmpR family DNA-binding regulatory protein